MKYTKQIDNGMKDKRQTLLRVGNIPSPLSGDNGGPINGEIDILAGVELKSFEANPSNIKPFGFSILSWRVEGLRGFHVELQHQYVPKIGEKVITPPITGIYELSAHTKDASVALGQVQVVVDTSGCVMQPAMLNPKAYLEEALRGAIEDNPELYFQSYSDDTQVHYFYPTVSFPYGRIAFSLRLYARSGKWYIPDPAIHIDASFGLAVEAGSLIPVNEQISVDVSFPWYAWNWASAIALAMAIEDGEKMAKKYTEDGIFGLTQLINFYAVPPKGKRIRTVYISEGVNGIGAINVTSCPYDLIKDFANVSGTTGVIT
jgi:hypothetical protein